MPILSSAGGSTSTFNTNQLDSTSIRAASATTAGHDYGLAATVAGDIGLGVVNLVDDIGSSLPVFNKVTSWEKGDLNRALLNAIDSPGLTDFARENQGGISAVSAIGGVIGAELIARRITAPASFLMQGLRTLPYARRVATLDAQYANAMRVVRHTTESLARRGALGAEQFVGRVALPGEGIAGIATGGREITRASALSQARKFGALRGVRNAAVTEGLLALGMNQNDFLYTDSAAHNLMLGALGLGLGAGIETVATSYLARKHVNSDQVTRLFADATDPEGLEANKLFWKDRVVGKEAKDYASQTGSIGFLGGSVTDDVTSLLVRAKTLRENLPNAGSPVANQTLKTNRDLLATQEMQRVQEEVQKVTTKGLSTDGGTRFSHTSSGYWNHLNQVMHDDTGALYGAEAIAAVNPERGAAETVAAHFRRLDDLQTDLGNRIADPATTAEEKAIAERLAKRTAYERTLTPAWIIDGERATLSDAKALDGWVEPDITMTKADTETRLWEAVAEKRKTGIAVDESLKVYTPKNASVESLDHYDMIRLYRAGQRAIQAMKGGTAKPVTLPAKPSWFQLDMAEQLIRESNGAAKIAWPTGMTRESAMVESFAQKAEIVAAESKKLKAKQAASWKAGGDFDAAEEASKLRVKLNLPRLTAYERGVLDESEHPVEQLLRGAAQSKSADIRQMSQAELLALASQTKRIGDFAPATNNAFDSLMGSSFRYMLDNFGKPTQPLIMMMRPFQAAAWATDNLAERLAARKAYVASQLVDSSAQYTNEIARTIMSNPNYTRASATHMLMEPQIQGSVIGTRTQTFGGALVGGMKPRDWIARDQPTLRAAAELREEVERLTRDSFKRAGEPLQAVRQQLDNPRNAASSLLVKQFISYRPGWDLAGSRLRDLAEVALPGGKKGYGFLLRDTELNRTRWQQLFGQDMPKGATLPSPDGKDVILDELGLKFFEEFNRLTDTIRDNKNAMLRAQGLREIDKLDFYVPPPSIRGKFIGWTQDATGNIVPNMTVIAKTQSEFAAGRAAMNERIAREFPQSGYTFRSRDDIEQFANIWDRAQMDMIDPGTTAIQGGKRNRGGLAQAEIDMDGIKGITESVRNQYMNHGQDVLRTMMKDQINSAKARARASTPESAVNVGKDRDQKFRNVHDFYVENLTGASPLNSAGSLWGRVYNNGEAIADMALSAVTPTFSRVWEATNTWINKAKVWDKTGESRRDFEALSSRLGEYMPFRTAHEMSERIGAGKMPPQLADITGAMNRFTAGMMLRVAETAMPIMNLAGIVNAMPSVIRHLRQLPGETAAEHAARVMPFGMVHQGAGPAGANIATIDMAKVMYRGFQAAWKKESHPLFDMMARRGMLTQDVAEFHKQFGAIDSKSSMMQFFTGSKTAAADFRRSGGKLNQAKAGLYDKGVVGWLSILTDKSEDFSRSWAMMSGIELSKMLGIRKAENQIQFAHELSNRMIANYAPHNRPEMFQGAMGAPIGLFQSFMMNYYGRLFRYIETKDARSFATQYAMQAGFFGVTGVPGFKVVSDLFFNASQGDDDPMHAIYSRFGETTGDMLFGGVMSNIPKLANLLPGEQGVDGFNLYSRGDASVRLPVDNFPMNLPAVNMASKILQGSWQGIKAFSDSNPQLTAQQISEIASNIMPNRPLAGMIERFMAGGYDVDPTGQVVSETKGLMESTYRVMGLRSLRQAKEVEGFYASKKAMELRMGQSEALRLGTRAAIRSGRMDDLPGLFETYVNTGGDPRQFRRWIKDSYEVALETRGTRQLDDLLRNPNKMNDALRLMELGVGVDDDEATTNYADMMDEDDEVTGDMMDAPSL